MAQRLKTNIFTVGRVPDDYEFDVSTLAKEVFPDAF